MSPKIALNDNRNVAFYDSIAEDYDILDAKMESNKQVRNEVSKIFLQNVRGIRVLDFGGGTGLDLGWLTDYGFKVYFCEPSEKMRAKAIQLKREKIKNGDVQFLENNETDFATWKASNPFPEKVDAILANFAVLNNISDIKTMFESLAEIIHPDGIIVATILNNRIFKLYKSHFLKYLVCLLFGKTLSVKFMHNHVEQLVFLHSLPVIRKAASPYFKVTAVKDLKGFGFLCLVFSGNR